MFTKLSDRLAKAVPQWWPQDARYWRLERYDRLLYGTFYDHLKFAFYEECDPSGTPVPIEERRPSEQYHLPNKVARDTSRKLFAGRHVPRIHHPDKKVQKRIKRLARRCRLYQTMRDIAFRGSVGSIAATFDVYGDQANPNIKISIWAAKYCIPSFDEAGDLASLRIQYVTDPAALTAFGATGLDSNRRYWFIREITKDRDIYFLPIDSNDWNPVQGFTSPEAQKVGFREWEEKSEDHALGFVPGQWFRNLSGGEGIDGCCTWSPAIPNAIDLDYTMSMIGRGVRYNAAPQLVTIGRVMNSSDNVIRSPMVHLEMEAGYKEEDGQTTGAGDAKLLEMTGQGTEAGLKFTDKLRNMALEQISAARKDPEQMKGPMSGRAMEYLDDEWHDLVMELRSSYGEDGMLPFLKKMCIATDKFTRVNADNNIEAISLTWPRLFQPTPADLGQIMPALQIAVNPFGLAQAAQPAQPAGANGGGAPAQPQVLPAEGEQFLTVAEARQWLKDNMDIGVLEDDEDGDEEEEEDDDLPEGGDEVPIVPEPLSDGGGPPEDENVDGGGGSGEVIADPFAAATAGGVAKVTAGAPR